MSGSERPQGMTRREALVVLAAAGMAACFSERPDDTMGPDDVVEVSMTPELRFDPERIEIEAGTTVVWRNRSGFVHTSTADPSLADDPDHVVLPPGAEPWHSGSVPGGGEFRRVFEVPGEYRYFCVPHEGQDMLGTIVVS